MSAHGALNFAAALSVSALLKLKGFHTLLPEDSIQPGKISGRSGRGHGHRFAVYLKAPSPARYSYIEKRIAAKLPHAKLLGLAWSDSEGGRTMINPQHAVTMIPAEVEAQSASSRSVSARACITTR